MRAGIYSGQHRARATDELVYLQSARSTQAPDWQLHILAAWADVAQGYQLCQGMTPLPPNKSTIARKGKNHDKRLH